MNKAITDGVPLMPPAFEYGLDVWSSGDGTPGSDTYDGAPNAALVPADQDFGACLELVKTDTVQKLRYMGETPLLPGCYLRVKIRIKAISGNLPGVRVAAWAGAAGGAHVNGLTEVGSTTTLSSYGDVVEIAAIIGAGNRTGVDMVWGTSPIYGHFGLDLTGANGGVVRIDDIEIEDATHVFHRNLMNWVDVRDFGAIGDGITDDSAAFEAADVAAGGRSILVSAGTYRLEQNVTLESRVVFEGTVSMPVSAILSLTKSFDLPTYIDAFGDEEEAFKKAFQSLLNSPDHESLDMGGRSVSVNGPIDMQAAVANKTTYSQRRHIHNGQFYAQGSSVWDTVQVTSQATYDPDNPRLLTGVSNVANVPIGALVEGNGVGREIYVRDTNIGAQEVTLSDPLFDAAGTQVFTFKRFQYMLDFSGFSRLDKFSMSDIEIQCNGKASGIMLADTGVIFHLRDSFITRPKYRGISSKGTGCQGMLIDRCQFLSDEGNKAVQDRDSIVLNTNGNDVKLRNNRATQFRHFAIVGGSSSVISGNHFFQGDAEPDGVRLAGIALLRTNCNTTITGNYIDNCFIEWTNEREPYPDFTGGFGFSALSMTNNSCLSGDVAPWFTYLVIKPHGTGHGIADLTVSGNLFKSINGTIDRVERVDTSFADLDYTRMRNILFAGNAFSNVSDQAANPLTLTHTEGSESQSWTVDCAPKLPFGAYASAVDSVVALGAIRTTSNASHFGMPFAETEIGPNGDQIRLNWQEPVRGKVNVTVRMDG